MEMEMEMECGMVSGRWEWEHELDCIELKWQAAKSQQAKSGWWIHTILSSAKLLQYEKNVLSACVHILLICGAAETLITLSMWIRLWLLSLEFGSDVVAALKPFPNEENAKETFFHFAVPFENVSLVSVIELEWSLASISSENSPWTN